MLGAEWSHWTLSVVVAALVFWAGHRRGWMRGYSRGHVVGIWTAIELPEMVDQIIQKHQEETGEDAPSEVQRRMQHWRNFVSGRSGEPTPNDERDE